MKKTFALVALMMALAIDSADAQAQMLTPEGWETIMEESADLDKDGINDVVQIVRSLDEEHTMKREDGYVYNFNEPVLKIWHGSADGKFALWKEVKDFLPASEEFVTWDNAISITPKGAIIVSTSSFASAGSWSSDTYSHTYRYQNGDFYLIGADAQSLMRNTLDVIEVSWNFLTGKQQVKRYNVGVENSKHKERETWKTIGKKPLRRLGTVSIYDYQVE